MLLFFLSFKSSCVFSRKDGDARFTYLDASNIHRQIDSQDCDRLLNPVEVIRIVAVELLCKISTLCGSWNNYIMRENVHLIPLPFGMKWPANVVRVTANGYADICHRLGVRIDEVIQLFEKVIVYYFHDLNRFIDILTNRSCLVEILF